MAEIRMEGSRGSGKINVDMKYSNEVLQSLFDLLNIDISTTTNTIPLPMILINGPLKPGLSATKMATSIIKRQEEAIEQQNYTFSAGGISEAMEFIRCQEIVKAIQTQMRIDLGTIGPVLAPVATTGGPGTATIQPLQGYGQAY